MQGGACHFRSSADRFGNWFETNTNLLPGAIGPISSRNDYLNTVFDDVVNLWGSCKTMPSHSPHRKIFVLLPIRWVPAFFFLTGGDGSFPGTKTTFMLGVFFLTITTRNKENIWSYSKPKETYCLRRPSHWKSFLIKTTAVVVYTNYSTTEPTYIINAILEKYAYICSKSLQAQFL